MPFSSEGEAGLSRFTVQIFRPVQPMLAETASGVDEALTDLEQEVALEWKLDGARIQVHKAGDEIKVFTRNLREVTPAVPEVVEAAQLLAVNEAILDGEVIALRPDGTPHTVPANDAAVREEARRRSAAGGSSLDAVLLRLPLCGRRVPDRPAADRNASRRSAPSRLPRSSRARFDQPAKRRRNLSTRRLAVATKG